MSPYLPLAALVVSNAALPAAVICSTQAWFRDLACILLWCFKNRLTVAIYSRPFAAIHKNSPKMRCPPSARSGGEEWRPANGEERRQPYMWFPSSHGTGSLSWCRLSRCHGAGQQPASPATVASGPRGSSRSLVGNVYSARPVYSAVCTDYLLRTACQPGPAHHTCA